VLTGRVGSTARSPGWRANVPEPEAGSVALVRVGRTVLVLGFALRLLHYLENRSLSIDESYLALNLIEKSPTKLLHALSFGQAAPLGFLEAQKLVVTLAGRSEHAVRLLPLLASFVALAVFYRIARALLSPVSATLAIAVFALLDPLVYYSATAKQYGFDVLGSVLVLALALRGESRPLRRSELLALAPFGVVLVWSSHASAFSLAGLGVLFALNLLEARDRRAVAVLGVVIASWVAAFTVEYELSQANLTRIIGAFQQGGGAAFAQTGPGWLDRSIDRLRYIVGLEDTAAGTPVLGSLSPELNRGLTVLLLLVAVVGFALLGRRRPRIALVLAVPPVLAVAASGVHRYPLVGRTLLFTLAGIALCVGEAARLLAAGRTPAARVVAGGVLLVSVVAVAALPASHVVHPRTDEEMRPVLRYLGAHVRHGDALYLSNGAQYATAYYHLCGCAAFDVADAWPFAVVSGPSQNSPAIRPDAADLVVQPERGTPDVTRLLGRRRVWILVAELPKAEKAALLEYLTDHGRRLQSFRAQGNRQATARLYLYDLRRDR
jgi:hypothetical protein